MIARPESAAIDASSIPAEPVRRRLAGPELPRPLFWLADTLCLIAAFYVAYMAAPSVKAAALDQTSRFSTWLSLLSPEPGGDYRAIREVVWVLPVMWAVTVLSLQAMGAYDPLHRQSRARILLSTFVAPFLGLGVIAMVLFALRTPSWSRLFIFLFTGLSAVTLCTYRSTIRWYRTRRAASGVYAKSVAFVGSPAAVNWLRVYFQTMTSTQEYRVIGWLSVTNSSGPSFSGGQPGESLPYLGSVDQLGDLLVHRPIHEVVAIQGTAASDWLLTLIDVCDYFRVTLRIVPEALLSGRPRDLHLTYHSDPLRLPEIVLHPRDFDSEALFVKRVIDIVGSVLALLVLAPLFAIVALLIKITTPGLPVFYRWRVVGYKGTPFTGYKFTTMVEDAEARRQELLPRNEMQGPVFKIKDDPRVTPIGRFLRRYSINELPQLWSVLKGDMSLVGPRPAFPHELVRYELWHKRKLCVRPGMTCLWQVRGRNRVSNFDDWVRMDLEYIDKWSLWLDVRILARTAWVVVAGTGS